MAGRVNWQPSLFDDLPDPLRADDTPLWQYTDLELAAVFDEWKKVTE